MTDAIERKAWRSWLLEPSPENALKWALTHARANLLPGVTPLRSQDLSGFGQPTLDVLDKACMVYLGTPFKQTAAEDLRRLTECHYWLLDSRPGPQLMSEIRRFYQETVTVPLEVGTEEAARLDHTICTERSMKEEAVRVRETDLKQREAYAAGRADRAEKRIRELESGLINGSELAEARAMQSKIVNLERSNEILKSENERLALLVQERAASRKKSVL